MGRLLIVSNRLPVTVRLERDGMALDRSPGGLATALAGPHAASEGPWIGWPGIPADLLDETTRAALDARLAEARLVPVHLSQEEVNRYYLGYSNSFVWPL